MFVCHVFSVLVFVCGRLFVCLCVCVFVFVFVFVCVFVFLFVFMFSECLRMCCVCV